MFQAGLFFVFGHHHIFGLHIIEHLERIFRHRIFWALIKSCFLLILKNQSSDVCFIKTRYLFGIFAYCYYFLSLSLSRGDLTLFIFFFSFVLMIHRVCVFRLDMFAFNVHCFHSLIECPFNKCFILFNQFASPK